MRVLILAAVLSAAPPESPEGNWIADGYGLFFQIEGDRLESWEVTKVSCLPSMKASAVAAPPGAIGAFRAASDPTTLVLLRDGESGRMRLHRSWAASDVVLERTERKPEACRKPMGSGPQADFDVFAETWAEQYPFFSLKGADWAAIVARSRARVTDNTTPEELFDILEDMIAPFEDAHTFIGAGSLNRRFSGARTSPASVEREERESAYGLAAKYLVSPLRSFCEGQVEVGMLRPDVGYLRLRSFSGYHSDRSFESGLEALEAALDELFAFAGSWKGLVIDVRINSGGADPYGLAIASRLADREYVAYAKQARSDPSDPSRWTAEQENVVTPSKRPGFRGPVVELIGIDSVSAAETFTQALLLRRPAVVRIGENTQGVFSDVLARNLPNGWRFGLPNERFVTEGRSYDGPGIAPDIPVLSFTPEGLASGRDAGIEAALARLGVK
jgi:Peptidase family S41/Tricorn protease C1 domain